MCVSLPTVLWSAFPGTFFSDLSDVLKCSGGSSNGSGMTGQKPTWLEIATWLARKLGHQIGYYL